MASGFHKIVLNINYSLPDQGDLYQSDYKWKKKKNKNR